MHDKKEDLLIIKNLMEELIEKMDYNEDDFSERLGREKPEIKAISIEAEELPMDELDEDLMDESEDMEMALDPEMDEMSMMEEDESPEAQLKKRIMKLRG